MLMLTIILVNLLQLTNAETCTCEQLLSQHDCELKKCIWNVDSCRGATLRILDNSQIIKKVPFSYCDLFQQQNQCLSDMACSWIDGICQFFTGCSAYKIQGTYGKCNQISKRCFNDLIGDHCIEYGQCEEYKTMDICNITKYINGDQQLCYWEEHFKQCLNSSSCDQLPKNLNDDTSCRKYFSYCTFQQGVGCIMSGEKCKDQKTYESCKWDRSQTQQCFWNDDQCKERTCTNAPTSYLDNIFCQDFLSSKECILNPLGGCVKRTICSSILINEECTYDYQNKPCVWINMQCMDLICKNAPIHYITNYQCNKFLQGCITNGEGCVGNGECEDIKIQSACISNKIGQDCFWYGSCKLKTCSNAPEQYTSLNECQNYLSSCTNTNNGIGCTKKTCDNAPITLTTNQHCDNYLNNCITQKNGGCILNTYCNSITYEYACIKDQNGQLCFWDQGVCKDYNCQNAPSYLNNHKDCNQFLNTCTVNSDLNGCIIQTCENSLTQETCTVDYQQNKCVYYPKCQEKSCFKASKIYTKHFQCQNYDESCTVSNSGFGCMTIPLLCSAILIQESCQLKQTPNGYSNCGWNGTTCQDITCNSIPKSIKTTADCNKYLKGCISANPQDGNVQGCMNVPYDCYERKTIDNCETQDLKCVWLDKWDNWYCYDRTCDRAFGFTFTHVNCQKYMINCTVGDLQYGCMELRQNCYQYQYGYNCIETLDHKQCYWNSINNQCEDKLSCTAIYGQNHNECNQILSNCTVNIYNAGCQELNYCNQYITQNQCQISMNKGRCIWNEQHCRDAQCIDNIYSTSHEECSEYQTPNQQCTIAVKSIKGCMNRTHCSDYKYQENCYKDMDDNDCVWLSNSYCTLFQNCQDIQLNSINTNCEVIKFQCRNNDNNNGCIEKSCYQLTGQTKQSCEEYNSNCTVDKNNQCQDKLGYCQFYTTSTQCTFSKNEDCVFNNFNCISNKSDCNQFYFTNDTECQDARQFCYYNIYQGLPYCSNKSCTEKHGDSLYYIDCQNFDISCSVTRDKISCYNMLQDCTMYSDLNYCVKSQNGWCMIDQNSCQNFLSDRCDLIQSTSEKECQQYHSNCILNIQGTKCQNIMQQCYQYNNQSCARSLEGECVLDKPDYQIQKCIKVQDNQDCITIYLGHNNYNHYNCNKRNALCTSMNSYTCTYKSCSNAPLQNSFEECFNWFNKCTYNKNGKCVTIRQRCDQQQINYCYQSEEGECVIINNLCVKKTCDTASIDDNHTTHAQCTQYSNKCTSVGLGGCVVRQNNCNEYRSQIQCVIDNQNQQCYWSIQRQICLELTCNNIDRIQLYNNHYSCEQILNSCTIRPTGQLGCQQKSPCQLYQSENQCIISSEGEQCVWFLNINQQYQCSNKSCNTAPLSYNTFEQCQEYSQNENFKCTIRIINNKIQGCKQLDSCLNYNYQDECIIDEYGNDCVWFGYCQQKSCYTTNIIYKSNYDCDQYFKGCVLNNSEQGCMEKQQLCQQYYRIENCYQDIQGNECVWNSKIGLCEQKTCNLAPESVNSNEDCQNYSKSCVMYDTKCQILICEDYYYKTEVECENQMQGCTSDGNRCFKRTSCQTVMTEIGCTYDINNQKCQWVTFDKYPYCTIKSCKTAPKNLQTEEECLQYLSGCTTTKGGGCTNKRTCQEANVQSACNYDINRKDCYWDQIQSKCREIQCSDITGDSFTYCNKKKSNCTIGKHKKCTDMQPCSNYQNYQECIKGLDGPCIWLMDLKNDNQTYGACFLYNSCKSFKWKTHKECQRISSNCTTDGNQCISITKCSETNTQGGCYKGYDGDCFQSFNIEQNQNTCNLFQNCEQLNFKTHNECQNINKQCTTNGISNCQVLRECNEYTNEESCKINKNGIQKNENNYITSTGKCKWETYKCQNIFCPELNGNSHLQCQLMMISCTYDGEKCINIQNCKEYYSQLICENAKNNDNENCIWKQNKCQDISCSDILNGSHSEICQTKSKNCVSNGIFCIKKEQYCIDYIDKVSCESESNQGPCIFDQNTCMPLSCNFYLKYFNQCPMEIQQDKVNSILCQKNNQTCEQINFNTLNQDTCFKNTNYKYTWSLKQNKCLKCGEITNNQQNSTSFTSFQFLLIVVFWIQIIF